MAARFLQIIHINFLGISNDRYRHIVTNTEDPDPRPALGGILADVSYETRCLVYPFMSQPLTYIPRIWASAKR